MIGAHDEIPVVLFAYARPRHLGRTLASLRANRVPRIIAFCDGPKGEDDAGAVREARAQLRGIDWTELELVERPVNLGLGKSVLAGVSDVAQRYEAFVVFEDDLICSPGTYAWMAAALRHYRDEPRVFSVTGWTHPRVIPSGTAGSYFDARAESWSWGAYARSWRGMGDATALEKMRAAEARGVARDACGPDLPPMAERESRHNLWAVRWVYHHLQQAGLCLRPPVALVQHAGFDEAATNARSDDIWTGAVLADRAPAPGDWPPVVESSECRQRWREAAPVPPGLIRRLARKARRVLGGTAGT
jgi:hypothetical protein